jgi:hypothetical protein|mmetsp:Transcript_105257/g.177903  ORF Transcript_105257/g.177903 Transcript_105257/m.177903 type:complete len:82 (-) Transcript_105257:575-820(-)
MTAPTKIVEHGKMKITEGEVIWRIVNISNLWNWPCPYQTPKRLAAHEHTWRNAAATQRKGVCTRERGVRPTPLLANCPAPV